MCECEHGCWDCGHFDGGNCINVLGHYGCLGDICAEDCSAWEGDD